MEFPVSLRDRQKASPLRVKREGRRRRQRERRRERERDRESESESERQRQRETQTETDRETQRDRERQRQTETERYRDRERAVWCGSPKALAEDLSTTPGYCKATGLAAQLRAAKLKLGFRQPIQGHGSLAVAKDPATRSTEIEKIDRFSCRNPHKSVQNITPVCSFVGYFRDSSEQR